MLEDDTREGDVYPILEALGTISWGHCDEDIYIDTVKTSRLAT